jgi:hypothetical protein
MPAWFLASPVAGLKLPTLGIHLLYYPRRGGQPRWEHLEPGARLSAPAAGGAGHARRCRHPPVQHGQVCHTVWREGGERGLVSGSVPDPDPPDPHVFGPPGSESGSISQRCGSGSF